MLNRLALRLCVVQALIGRTFAGAAVKDSRITPIDTEIPSEPSPFIAVYTDDQGADGLALTIEIGVTAAMAVEDDKGKEVIIAGVPPTDAGIEMTIDAIERQIHTALEDPENAWAELYRTLLKSREAPISRRGAAAKEGERYAGRQVVITCQPLADPTFGREISPGSFWGRLLTAVAASPELKTHDGLLRTLLGGDAAPAEWRLQQRAVAATRADADALGIAPVAGTTEARFGVLVADVRPVQP